MSDDDRLLDALGERARRRAAREGRALDPRWDALARGELDAEAEAALQREAEATAGGRQAWEAFRPLGADFQARAARRIREARTRPVEDPAEDPGASERGREPTPFAPKRRLPWLVPALAAALLASIAGGLLIGRGAPSGTAPLPAYELTVTGVRAERSSTPGSGETGGTVTTLVPGSRLELVLRPATEAPGSLAAALYLAGNGTVERWPIAGDALRIAPSGAVRVAGTAGVELPWRPGAWTLLAIVGHDSAMPSPDEVRARWRGGAPAGGWILLTTPLRMAAEG